MTTVEFSPRRAEQLMSAGQDGEVKLWDVRAGNVVREYIHAQAIYASFLASVTVLMRRF